MRKCSPAFYIVSKLLHAQYLLHHLPCHCGYLYTQSVYEAAILIFLFTNESGKKTNIIRDKKTCPSLFLLVSFHMKSFLLLQPYDVYIMSQQHHMVLSLCSLIVMLCLRGNDVFYSFGFCFKMIFHVVFFHMNLLVFIS